MTDVPVTARCLRDAHRGLAPDPRRKGFLLASLPVPVWRVTHQAAEQPEAPREAAVRPICLFCAADS
jgi:hypothetical protein